MWKDVESAEIIEYSLELVKVNKAMLAVAADYVVKLNILLSFSKCKFLYRLVKR
jgi:hypothetical protein